MPSLSIWMLTGLTVMGAAVIQSLTGFGFGLVAIPFLLLIFPPHQAILISMILSLSSLLLQGFRLRDLVNWIFVRELALIGMPDLISGLLLADYLNPDMLKGIIGVILLVYVSFQWFQVEIQRKKALMHNFDMAASDNSKSNDGIREKENENNSENINKKETSKPKGFYLAGIFSGLLTGIAGLPGPPVIAVLVNSLRKDIFRATVVWYFIIEYTLAVSAFFLLRHSGPWVVAVYRELFLLLLPTVIGFHIGVPMRRFFSETNFKRLVFGLLFIIGVTSSWNVLNMFWH